MMFSLVVVCTYIVLALALCTLTGYAAEDGTQGAALEALELPNRETPVAASYSDYCVIWEDGTLIQSDQHRMGSGFNKTVEPIKNAVYVHHIKSLALLSSNQQFGSWR